MLWLRRRKAGPGAITIARCNSACGEQERDDVGAFGVAVTLVQM